MRHLWPMVCSSPLALSSSPDHSTIIWVALFFRYKNRHVLKTHMPTHIYGPTKCDICGHVSPHRRAWVEHKRQHRPGIKDRWKCDVCDRGFREKKRLEVQNASLDTKGLQQIQDQYISSIQIIELNLIFRTIITSTLERRAHISVRNAENCSDSVHRFQCIGKSCIRSENLGLAQTLTTKLSCFAN